MGADGTVTSNVAAVLRTFLRTAGSANDQYVRLAKIDVTPANPTSWTVTSAGSSSVLAADVNRVALIITSYASARVFVRFDLTTPTTPTAALNTTFLDPNDRYIVDPQWVPCAVSLKGANAGGFVLLTAGTAP